MISYDLQIHTYSFQHVQIDLCVPSEKQLFQTFQSEKEACPYWGQVWSSAIGLCQYIVENHSIFHRKTVLEIAGGLGLPSLVAAHFAQSVTCSDYIAEAVSIVEKSAQHNRLPVKCEIIDWNDIPEDKMSDIVLLSDINYEPAQFDALFAIIKKLINRQVEIILSTPQRLMAKPFIEKLLPFVSEQTEIEVVNKAKNKEWISIYVLGIV